MHAYFFLLAALLVLPALSFDNGLAKTPPMGWNSWNCFGAGVTAADLRTTADSFVSLGLAAAGYEYIISDDGWMAGRDASGRMYADEVKFPGGWTNLSAYIQSKGLKAGLYSAASSVVCSGRVGSLYNEYLDAETFASWNIDYVKYDNCGEYGLGNSRFYVFMDGINRTGRPMVVSTEPFSLHPNPSQREFAHLWRTTNDINANYGTILDRADTNDKWAPLAGPGSWCDPDMLEIGNGGLSDAESRTHFGLWALMKSPLILGTPLPKLSPSQLSIISNKDVIAVNQDPLGIQGRKLAIDGAVTPRFVGVAPCAVGAEMGYNGVSKATLVWSPLPSTVNASAGTVLLYNNATGRCLSVGAYFKFPTTPLLLPCNASDLAQAWVLPTGVVRLGGLVWYNSTTSNPPSPMALTVGDSSLYSAIHGNDPLPLPDANYGLMNLTLTSYAPEPPCNNRNCDNYAPGQNWYWSERDGRLHLGHFSANDYRCFGPNCYQLTSHLPTGSDYCLSHVLSFDGNVGTGGGGGGGSSVWGGPLSGVDTPYGDYVLALANHGASPINISAPFSLLEVPGLGDDSQLCARELFSKTSIGVVTGSVSAVVPSHDIAMFRLTTGAAC